MSNPQNNRKWEEGLIFFKIKMLWHACLFKKLNGLKSCKIYHLMHLFTISKPSISLGPILHVSYLCSYFLKSNNTLQIDSICDHVALQSQYLSTLGRKGMYGMNCFQFCLFKAFRLLELFVSMQGKYKFITKGETSGIQ